jgi:hypothetical protein
MRHATHEITSEFAPKVMCGRTSRNEREYLQEQTAASRAGMRQALLSVRGTLPGLVDPRAWAKYHPVASRALLLGGIAVVAAAICARQSRPAQSSFGRSVDVNQARSTGKHWLRWVSAGCRTILGAAGRALIGLGLTQSVRPGRSAQATARASSAEHEASQPAAARRARRS